MRRPRELRRQQTDTERALWFALRDRRLSGAKFSRQVAIGPYIVDFLCVSARLIIEADGGQHGGPDDRARQTWLEQAGYRVLRFWNNEVTENLDGVLTTIATQLQKPSPARGRGLGEGGQHARGPNTLTPALSRQREREQHPWEAHYPPGLDWGAPLPFGTLPDLLARAVANFAPRPAINFRNRAITYADLNQRVQQTARALAALGLGPGQSIALLLPNTPAHPISFFGALQTGARVVHLTPLDPARAVAAKLVDSQARTLITTNLPGTLPQAIQAWQEGACERLIVVDDREWGEPSGAVAPPDGAILLDDGPAIGPPPITPADIALLQYTGGTTGAPRAAMLTHANLTSTVSIYTAWNRAIGRDYQPGDRVMCVLPLFHIYALSSVFLRSIAGGAELLLRQRFDPAAALDDIERGRCTQFAGVPTMWIALVNHPDIGRRDLSSLRVCSSGGAALPPDVASRFEQLTGLRLAGGWGMTETSPAGTNLVPGRAPQPGEIGVPLPGIEMDVVSLTDPRQALPPGEVGEVRIRGPNVTPGYWNRPEENAAAFVDGWLLTGDIGHMSEDGVFTLVDRKKDMLISGGYNVYPRAIEDAIHEHPDVREAAVIGVPDPYRGQAAKAYVSLRDGAPALTLDALRAFLADRLGRHELPAQLEVRAHLPHTAVGKLAKLELIAELEARKRSAHG